MPILVEGSSQTELKHPKNVYTQYEPRVFTADEVTKIWESDEMKKFMIKVNFFKIFCFSYILQLNYSEVAFSQKIILLILTSNIVLNFLQCQRI